MNRAVALVAALGCGILLSGGVAAAQGIDTAFQGTNPQREIEVGREVSREVERRFHTTHNPAYLNRVARIGQALIDSLPKKVYPYQFKVLAVNEFNAFSLPGGFIYVNDGLLAQLSTDDAVAFVLAHELIHASHRHWAQQREKLKGDLIGGLAIDLLGGGGLGALMSELMGLHYSREMETDADQAGLELVWSAGFAPGGALQAVQIMKDLEQGKRVPKYLRTHPPASDRQKRLEEYAAELAQRKRPAPALRPPETSADSVALTGTLPAVPIATNPWFPLTVGTTWVYEARLTGAPPSTFVVRIASRLRTPTGDVFRAETGLGSDAVVPFQYLATAESLWRRNRPSVAESPWQVEFVTAVPEGQPQTHGDSEFSRLPPETVSLPCGVFTDTLHLRKRAAGKSYELWFGRGIGLLKRTCVETGVTETLIRYTIAPPG